MLAWLERVLDARAARLGLTALIVISVLPYAWIEHDLRYLFLSVFGAEFLLRVLLLVSGRTRFTLSEAFFLLADVLALWSFLPVEGLLPEPYRILFRSLRLVRLVVLVRFFRGLVLDVWVVMTRREQLQQLGLVTASAVGMTFVAAVVLNQLTISYDYDLNPTSVDGFWDRMWWAFRQVESPDNLVHTLRLHPALIVVSLGLTVVGVFIFSYLVGIGTSVVEQVLRAQRRRPVAHRAHTLIVGPRAESEILVREFARIHEKNRVLRGEHLREIWSWLWCGGPRAQLRTRLRMTVLGEAEEPPAYLYERELKRVVYRQGDLVDQAARERISAAQVKRLLLLSEESLGDDADAVALTRLGALRRDNPSAHAYVELLETRNRDLVEAIGGEGTVPLDMPRVLGLFLAQHLIAPGVAPLFHELLTADGSEIYTHVFVDPAEHRMLERLRGEFPSFEALAAAAYRTHAVTLLGTFERDGQGAPLTDLLAVSSVAPRIAPLGTPVEQPQLAGLVGLAETYGPLRRFTRDLLNGRVPVQPDPPADPAMAGEAERIVSGLTLEGADIGRVLAVGASRALPSLIESLRGFAPEVAIRVLLTEKEAGGAVAHALAELGDAVSVVVERGGDLAQTVTDALRREPTDAVVFLSDPMAADPDASTTLRVLRFARALATAKLASPRLHVVAELLATERGRALEQHVTAQTCGFAPGELHLTLLSTRRVKNYFLVHSAFVPGVAQVYERLLGPDGPTVLRFRVPTTEGAGSFRLPEIAAALAARGRILMALELQDGEVVVAPRYDLELPEGEPRAIFALGELRPR